MYQYVEPPHVIIHHQNHTSVTQQEFKQEVKGVQKVALTFNKQEK